MLACSCFHCPYGRLLTAIICSFESCALSDMLYGSFCRRMLEIEQNIVVIVNLSCKQIHFSYKKLSLDLKLPCCIDAQFSRNCIALHAHLRIVSSDSLYQQ